jgi:hypothetical protein
MALYAVKQPSVRKVRYLSAASQLLRAVLAELSDLEWVSRLEMEPARAGALVVINA